MDDALVQTLATSAVGHPDTVLILVLMDDALVRIRSYVTLWKDRGLNPCFNG